MIGEAKLESGHSGLLPASDGWFVANVRDVAWMKRARDDASRLLAANADAPFRTPLLLRAADLPAGD